MKEQELQQAVERWKQTLSEQADDDANTLLSISKRKLTEAKTMPLSKLERMFMAEQEGKGNTLQTRKYYTGIWHKLYEYLAYEVVGAEGYVSHSKNEDLRNAVSKLPVIALQIENFQNKYRIFMQDVDHNGEQTIQSHMRGLRAILKFTVSSGWLLEAPRIVVRDTEPPIKATFTEKEIEILCRKPNTDDFVEYRAWMITRYTMATGNRSGSIASLKVKDIDFEDGFVNVNVVKNKQPIRLPLVKGILKELREYVAYYRTDANGEPMDEDPLFPNQFGDAVTSREIGRMFSIYCRNRGLTKSSIHLLRHTYAKRYITDGGDVLSLKTMLGHKSLKMVNHYARLYGSDIKGIVEKHALINQTKMTSGKKKITKRKKV